MLDLEDASSAKILVVVGRTAGGLSLNLKAPVILNLQRRLGRQVVTNGELPVRYELGSHKGSCEEVRSIALNIGRVGGENHSIEHKGRSHRCLSYPDNAMKAS